MIGWLALRVIVGVAALGIGWGRRSRAEWHAYAEQHGDPRPTRASMRAKRG